MNPSLLLIPFFITLLLTPLVRLLAFHSNHLDKPDDNRKVHSDPIPRIGGIGIFFAVVIMMVVSLQIDRQLSALLLAMTLIFLVGIIDDTRGLPALKKLFLQVIVAGVVLAGGIGIVSMTLPFVGTLQFDGWSIPMEVYGFKFNILPIANSVTILWIISIINAINLLDGLDGLVAGNSIVALIVLIILGVSVGNVVVVTTIAIILLGALLGFLPYNFYPARIFLGDSGSYVIGLLLAVLPIYAGTKLSVGTIVISIAIIDMFWAVGRRIINKKSPFAADRGHVHHQLLDSGLSHLRVVLFFYLFSAVIGLSVLFGGIKVAWISVLLILLAITGRLIFSKRRIKQSETRLN